MDLLEVLGKVGFDWRLALAQMVNFMLVFWLLSKLVFKPMNQTIEKRQAKLDEALSSAEKAASELEAAEAERERLIQAARSEATLMTDKASERAEEIVKSAHKKAESEHEAILKRAEGEIESAWREMQAEFKKRSAEYVATTTAKLMREDISSTARARAVKEA